MSVTFETEPEPASIAPTPEPYARRLVESHEIPPELIEPRVWVPWRLVEKPDKSKPGKIPISPITGLETGRKDNHQEFAGSFEEAYRFAQRHPNRVQGLGILLLDGCGISGIDLDQCRDPKTGELSNLSKEIMSTANTYFEVSPGLAGIRGFFLGNFGGHTGNKHDLGIEFYEDDGTRFLTVTGNHIEDSPFCAEKRDLTTLGKRYFTSKRITENSVPTLPAEFTPFDLSTVNLNPHTINVIRTGDVSSYGEDRSKALFAIAKDLVRVGLSDTEIACILCDPANGISEKPLSERNGDVASAMDWIVKYTVKKARETVSTEGVSIQSEAQPESPTDTPKKKWSLLPIDHLLDPPTPLTWLVKDYLMPETLVQLFGDPASGKSLLTLDWAASIATGLQWNGRSIKQAPVVYLAGEGHFGIRRRLKAWAIHHKAEEALRSAPIVFSSHGTNLGDSEELNQVMSEIDTFTDLYGNPALIVVDTVHRHFNGDENSSKDWGVFFRSMDKLMQSYSATILLVHHSGHGDKNRSRGSSAIRGAMDTDYCILNKEGIRTLTATKVKDAPTPPPMAFTVKQIELPWRTNDGDPENSVVLVSSDTVWPTVKSTVTPVQRLGFQTLLNAIDKNGLPALEHIPQPLSAETNIVSLENWRSEFYSRHMGDTSEAKKKAFQRVRNDLSKLGVIDHLNDWYWVVPNCGGIDELVSLLNAHTGASPTVW